MKLLTVDYWLAAYNNVSSSENPNSFLALASLVSVSESVHECMVNFSWLYYVPRLYI